MRSYDMYASQMSNEAHAHRQSYIPVYLVACEEGIGRKKPKRFHSRLSTRPHCRHEPFQACFPCFAETFIQMAHRASATSMLRPQSILAPTYANIPFWYD